LSIEFLNIFCEKSGAQRSFARFPLAEMTPTGARKTAGELRVLPVDKTVDFMSLLRCV